MRIVIDLQGAQTESRFRGIGRYTLSLAQAIARNRGRHEVFLALSDLLPDTIQPIRAAFDGILPQDNIRVWAAPGPTREQEPGNIWRREAAELVHEGFLSALRPDIVHLMSLFEGYVDDAVTSIGRFRLQAPVSVILYDLIPLIDSEHYLKVAPGYEAFYLRKIDYLKRASLLLAISESSRQEAIDHLGFHPGSVVNVSAGADSCFRPLSLSPADARQILHRLSFSAPFLLYSGGFDERKNLARLVQAYGRLPEKVRSANLLVFAGKITENQIVRLKQVATAAGLDSTSVRFTGYVSDHELAHLYNLCKVAVLPSLHEGFGLPALEAMACGRAVIGARASSLPEVIGRQDALFDPLDEGSIAEKLEQVLTDDEFRAALERHGLEQAQRFSWDRSATLAMAAFDRLHAERRIPRPYVVSPSAHRLKLAFVSPLPPDHSGVADYSAELLPELARHYEIEAICPRASVSDPWVKANIPIRDEAWFRSNADLYDRVLYQFGNSPFHQHMFELLEDISGVVVLHDFFLYSVIRYMETSGFAPTFLTASLYHSHGYKAVADHFHALDLEDGSVPYPCNLSVLQNARGVIVHAEFPRRLAVQWYGENTAKEWTVIPSLATSAGDVDRPSARQRLNIKNEDFVICSFGIIAPTKLNDQLLAAYLESELARRSDCALIFVGENHTVEYAARLKAQILKHRMRNRIRITGWIDEATLGDYLAAADVAVQLRTMSRGETSRAVLQCMGHGIPTIVNSHGSFIDLEEDGVWKLPGEFSNSQLSQALESLWRDGKRRQQLGDRAREIIRTEHAPSACADQYAEAIERFYDNPGNDLRQLTNAIGNIETPMPVPDSLPALAQDIAQSIPLNPTPRQLLVDVSEFKGRDRKDGIHRVVRNILREWLANPPAGFRVEPVYAKAAGVYCYARRFTLEFLDCPADELEDEPMEYQSADVFLCLDWNPGTTMAQRGFYQRLRRHGVNVQFLVYDLLPIQMPHYFPDGMAEEHRQWLEVVAESDGAVCISKTVAADFSAWIEQYRPQMLHSFRVGWYHNGADFDSTPTTGLPPDAPSVLNAMKARPSFLMVGTIEPRKGHAQALSAFEQLWHEGVSTNLIIVGNEGWMHVPDDMRRGLPEIVERIRQHPELGKRLFWLEGASNEYLDMIYASSACLIAAAEGEGFGLPLIEAAQHRLPIIGRAIPVFREVGGDHIFYFQGLDPADLAGVVKQWLQLSANGQAPRSDGIPWLTWKQSAANLGRILTGDPAIQGLLRDGSQKGSRPFSAGPPGIEV